METRRDIQIAGVGTISSGTYDDIDISGVGKSDGDIQCNTIEVSGVGKINGNLVCEKFSAAGTAKVQGDCSFNTLNCSGMSRIFENARGYEVNIEGMFRAENLECEKLRCQGSIKIGKGINAGFIDIDFIGKSRVEEVYGEDIKIRYRKDNKDTSIIEKFIKRKFVCEIIEGDNIFLEGVYAEVVRGKNVTIGEGCKIEFVEYHDTINIHDTAKVEKTSKIEERNGEEKQLIERK